MIAQITIATPHTIRPISCPTLYLQKEWYLGFLHDKMWDCANVGAILDCKLNCALKVIKIRQFLDNNFAWSYTVYYDN